MCRIAFALPSRLVALFSSAVWRGGADGTGSLASLYLEPHRLRASTVISAHARRVIDSTG